MTDAFSRTELLLGPAAMQRLAAARVIIFGVGGVGSWCAESLARTGIGTLTLVDSDTVAPSNINRQLMATTATIGRAKVDVLRRRLRDINPDLVVHALRTRYSEEWSEQYHLDRYDVVVDCIDSRPDKLALLVAATNTRAAVFSSMGAARKIDPTAVSTAEYWHVRGCPLGAALRKAMKRKHITLPKPVQCVYSEELLDNAHPAPEPKANGTLAHITAIFGFTLAGLVVEHLITSTFAQTDISS